MITSIKNIDWNKWVPLITGVGISIISAWYSIQGLAAIFSSAAISVMIMGAALEAGKVVTASYLYRNWSSIPFLIKTYFSLAVVILMLITSMGTFGYLSRAHIQNSADISGIEAQISRIDEALETQRDRVRRAQSSLDQLDSAVDSMIGQDFATRGLSAREAQAEERERLQSTITESEQRIQTLLDERLPLTRQVRSQESEVGPIRYVAELIYGESNPELMENAVRYMIVLLVVVFDPLAVMLIMMSTNNQGFSKKKIKGTRKRRVIATNNPPPIAKTKVTVVSGDKWEDASAPITNSILDDVRNSSLQS